MCTVVKMTTRTKSTKKKMKMKKTNISCAFFLSLFLYIRLSRFARFILSRYTYFPFFLGCGGCGIIVKVCRGETQCVRYYCHWERKKGKRYTFATVLNGNEHAAYCRLFRSAVADVAVCTYFFLLFWSFAVFFSSLGWTISSLLSQMDRRTWCKYYGSHFSTFQRERGTFANQQSSFDFTLSVLRVERKLSVKI